MSQLKRQLEKAGWEYHNRYQLIFTTFYDRKYLSIVYGEAHSKLALYFMMNDVNRIFSGYSINDITIELLLLSFKTHSVDPFVIESPLYPLVVSQDYLN